MKNRYPGFLVLAAVLACASDSGAEDAVKAVVEAGINASFSEAERQIIKKYFGEREVTVSQTDRESDAKGKNNKGKDSKGMPPGLAKRDSLPPGLAMQLQKNGTLPPGLAKRDLPSDLTRQLPPAPEGYERQVVEDAAIVLIHKATGRIADIVKDTVLD